MGLHCWGGFRPEAVTPLTPAPVERLWRITGLNHELSMLSIDRCGFASRVSVNDNVMLQGSNPHSPEQQDHRINVRGVTGRWRTLSAQQQAAWCAATAWAVWRAESRHGHLDSHLPAH